MMRVWTLNCFSALGDQNGKHHLTKLKYSHDVGIIVNNCLGGEHLKDPDKSKFPLLQTFITLCYGFDVIVKCFQKIIISYN